MRPTHATSATCSALTWPKQSSHWLVPPLANYSPRKPRDLARRTPPPQVPKDGHLPAARNTPNSVARLTKTSSKSWPWPSPPSLLAGSAPCESTSNLWTPTASRPSNPEERQGIMQHYQGACAKVGPHLLNNSALPLPGEDELDKVAENLSDGLSSFDDDDLGPS